MRRLRSQMKRDAEALAALAPKAWSPDDMATCPRCKRKYRSGDCRVAGERLDADSCIKPSPECPLPLRRAA